MFAFAFVDSNSFAFPANGPEGKLDARAVFVPVARNFNVAVCGSVGFAFGRGVGSGVAGFAVAEGKRWGAASARVNGGCHGRT